jgi:hypothetical protein
MDNHDKETLNLYAERSYDNSQLRKALKSARLMLYAWKAARKNMGLDDDHGELNDTIAEIDAVLASH